jgi:tetratricopeptide (TPR) repeat protein
VPATLLESLRRRLQRLTESALQLAQLAAVAQRDFTLALAASALGRAPLALAPILAELEAAQIFHGHAFSHDLVAEAVRASLPAALIGPLHQLVAEHLMAHGGAPAAIAFHLQQAGAEAAAVTWHLKAAQEARDRWQEAEAAAGFEAAARGLEAHPGAAGEATSAMAWRDAARAWISLSRQEEALQCLERGLSCARSPRERLRLRASRALALLNSRRYTEGTAEAFALTDELEAHADELDPAEVAAVLFASAIGVPYSSQPQRVAELCERLRERCTGGPPRVRQTYHLSYGLCLNWMGRPLQAEPELALAWQVADELGDLATKVNIANQMTRSATMRGDFAQALSSVEACLHAVQAAGHGPSFRADALSFRATVRLAQGRPAETMADLQQVQVIAGESGRPLAADWVAVLASAWLQRGRADRARATLIEAGEAGIHRGAAFVHVHLARSDPAALEAALAGLQRSWPADDAVMGLRRRVLMARLGHASPGEIDALLPELEARGLRPLLRSAHLAAARRACAEGNREAAAGHARRALATAEMIDPWVEEFALVWLDAAAAFRAAGAHGEADAALADGRRWVEQAADTLENEEERRAWLEGNATHRALLGRSAEPQG